MILSETLKKFWRAQGNISFIYINKINEMLRRKLCSVLVDMLIILKAVKYVEIKSQAWNLESFEIHSFQLPSMISTVHRWLVNILHCYSCIFRLDTDTVSHCLESMPSTSTEISRSTPSMDMAQTP